MSLSRNPAEVWSTIQDVKNAGAVVEEGVLSLRDVFDKALLLCAGGVVLLESAPTIEIIVEDDVVTSHDNSKRDGHTVSYMGDRPLIDGASSEVMPDFWLLRVDGAHVIPWASVGRTVIYSCMDAPFGDTHPPTQFQSPAISEIIVL